MSDALRAEDGAATPETIEAGRLLFAGECGFIWGAAKLAELPPPGLPEIAFAGRSNVGKSSLVNKLTGRNTLARVSNTPGRTQQLNFFNLADRLSLVDLPGYGFAKVSKDKVAQWVHLTETYLAGRPTLKRVLVLIDSRHGPKEPDRAAMRLLDQSAVSYQVVLTKTDKLKPAELDAMMAQVAEAIRPHVAAHPVIMPTSSETGAGIPELRAALATLGKPAAIG